MADPPLPDEVRREGVRRLAQVMDLFEEEIGGAPELAEFLEILGVSVPSNSTFVGDLQVPFQVTAKIQGGRRYSGSRPSRVAGLNDAVFVATSDLLSFLGEGVAAVSGRGASAGEFASGLHQVMNGSGVSFDDVAAADVVSLQAETPNRTTRLRPGDVLAIPASHGRHHLAVVVDRNRFGTALGLLRGTFPFPKIGDPDRCQARSRPVHTDEALVANGTWPVVDHDESLLSLFPAEPEIYHAPDGLFPGEQLGEFGSAESPSGEMREISKEEAEDVGLLNGTYQQVYLSEYVQQLLDDQD